MVNMVPKEQSGAFKYLLWFWQQQQILKFQVFKTDIDTAMECLL